MFIRQVKKANTKQGKVFYQYQLVQASRIDGKVKQNQVLYLGSDKALDDKQVRVDVLTQLQSKIFKQNGTIYKHPLQSYRNIVYTF